MTDLGHRMFGAMGAALSALLLAAGTASAAWEPAKQVDNQGASAGTTWNYPAIADGANGLSTAYFTQTTSSNGTSSNGGFALRRGGSDSGWGAPQALGFPSGQTVGAQNPLSAAADAQGNALALSEQIAGGVPGVDASSWPAGAGAPGNYSLLMSTLPVAGGVTDPQVAFDRAGTGYAVAGVGQGASNDEPIRISTYSPSTGAWTKAAPISTQVSSAAGTDTCPGGAPASQVCGQEPRLAVSPDGTVVVAYLKTFSGQIPGTTQDEVFAVRSPAGGVAASGGAGSFIKEVQITQSGDQVPIAPVPGASPSTTPPNFDVTIDGSDVATIVDAESQSGFNNQVFATRWPGGNLAPQGGVAISSSEPAPPASEPRLASDSAGDVSAMWTESSPNPTVQSLVTSELTGTTWTQPQTLSSSVDSPSNPGGYTVNTPPFWVAEDGAGNAYAVWTSNGPLQGATRSLGKNWNDAVAIAGVSSAVPGTARLATGLTGQADALVVSGNGTRNALYASRFTAPVTPPSSQPGTPKPGPAAVRPGRKPKPLVPCHARPALRILAGRSHASTKHIVVVGRASERKCRFPDAATRRANHVVRVYVTIYRPAPRGRCRFLKRNGHLTGAIPCTRPVKYAARGIRIWTLRLSMHVPAIGGGFLVRAWAVDGFGRMSVRGPASVTHLRVAGKPKPKHKHGH